MDPESSLSSWNAIMSVKRYSSYLKFTPGSSDSDLSTLMEGPIRKKLKIIPNNVTYVNSTQHNSLQYKYTLHSFIHGNGIRWGGQSDAVFNHLQGDFMKPRIKEVVAPSLLLLLLLLIIIILQKFMIRWMSFYPRESTSPYTMVR